MGYGHAERNLAAIRLLTTDTIALLRAQPALTAAEREWLTMATTVTPARQARHYEHAAAS